MRSTCLICWAIWGGAARSLVWIELGHRERVHFCLAQEALDLRLLYAHARVELSEKFLGEAGALAVEGVEYRPLYVFAEEEAHG